MECLDFFGPGVNSSLLEQIFEIHFSFWINAKKVEDKREINVFEMINATICFFTQLPLVFLMSNLYAGRNGIFELRLMSPV